MAQRELLLFQGQLHVKSDVSPHENLQTLSLYSCRGHQDFTYTHGSHLLLVFGLKSIVVPIVQSPGSQSVSKQTWGIVSFILGDCLVYLGFCYKSGQNDPYICFATPQGVGFFKVTHC